jgi:hypothetical protein
VDSAFTESEPPDEELDCPDDFMGHKSQLKSMPSLSPEITLVAITMGIPVIQVGGTAVALALSVGCK